MTDQQMVTIPQLTVDEAEQTVYNLDEVIDALTRAQHSNTPMESGLSDQVQFVLAQVLGTRNKIHQGLINAGVQLDYTAVN